jgi:RES domain-containing protein
VRAWRLTPTRHAESALSGAGAARYGGRWNPKGRPVVYLASSLALATLEVVVHATGAFVPHVAIELDLPDRFVTRLDPTELPDGWADDEAVTQAIAVRRLPTTSGVLAVPSAVVDPRAEHERNLVVDPTAAVMAALRERQRFEVLIDARLG